MHESNEHWLRFRELPGLELLVASNATRRWRIFHETYTICVPWRLGRKAVHWRYRGSVFEMSSGCSMLMEPGEMHANLGESDPSDFGVLMLAPALMVRLAGELRWDLGASPHFVSGRTDSPLVHASVSRTIRHLLSAPGALAEHRHNLRETVRALVGAGTFESRTQPAFPCHQGEQRLEAVRRLIEAHWDQGPVRRNQMLALARMKPRTFADRFRDRYGVGPRGYQLAIQLDRARALLRARKDLSIVAVAVRCGFGSPELFDRHFRDRFGVTPSEYLRAAARRNEGP